MEYVANILENNQKGLAYIGVVYICYLVLKVLFGFLRAVRSFVLAQLLPLGVNPAKLGKWAVVTGATDGIGKAYAMVLAKKGMNVVLISRSSEKLAVVAEEIASATKVQIKCITADFSGGLELYSGIEKDLEGFDIGLLVNNVGMSYDYPEYFHQVSEREHTFNKLLHVNIFSVTFMTAIVLPRMVEKKKGAIVNIGSASCFGFPLLTVYSATKAYVDILSKNLASEYSDKGILVQSVMPGFVATNMTRLKKGYLFAPLPIDYARSAVATIGVDEVTTGYWSHWFMLLMMKAGMHISYRRFMRFTRDRMYQRTQKALKANALKKSR